MIFFFYSVLSYLSSLTCDQERKINSNLSFIFFQTSKMLKILFKGVTNQCPVRNNSLRTYLFKRNFLSSAYELESEFNSRLNNKILKQVNPSSMYLELDQQFNRHKKLHAIDVDLYVNSLSNDTYTEELEDILYKFRLTPTTIDMMESTTHAFIRLYLKLNKVHDLLQILDDRLNYGIFPGENFSFILSIA